ncbi:hypothetical protein ACF07B_26050 [Streptomyces sp. NPDC015532]|uniref:hypothetical protein n=1 Tax=Streptomyces sp. NPDC015532 TaxID=3364960 RepID=UPI0037025FE6
MLTTAARPEVLADHTGRPKPLLSSALPYEHARLSVAFHEAGHAVLAMSYGIRVVTSEVVAWTAENGRWAMTGSTTYDLGETHAWRFAAQAAAGEIAQVGYLLAHGLWTPERAAACSAPHDREQAVDILARFGFRLGRDHVPAGGKSWGMVQGMARRKVGHLWPEIRTVAHAMNDRTVLTGDEIAVLTALSNPPLPGGAS